MTGGASASEASDAFGMGPSARYIRKLTFVYILIYVLFCMLCFDTLSHVVVVHILYDLVGMLYMTNTPCLHILNHGFMIHISIYDVIITVLIVIYVIIFMVLFFWIKLTWKFLKHLTIQKPSVRQFFLSGFAAALKPNQFDGKNFMIWRARMVLWLTAMNCYHAA
jgi:hypothetical protein